MANLDTLLSKNEERPDQKIQRNTSTQVRREFYLKDGDSLYVTGIQDDTEQERYLLDCKMTTWRADGGRWTSRFNHESIDMSDVPLEANTRSRLMLWVYVHYVEHKTAQNKDGSWRYGADSWEKIPLHQTKSYVYREQINDYKIVELPYSLKDAIIDAVMENDSRLDNAVFKLSRTGEERDTRYNFNITRKDMQIPTDKLKEQSSLPSLEEYFLEKSGVTLPKQDSQFDFSNPFESNAITSEEEQEESIDELF